MENEPLKLELTQCPALVLFEWLCQTDGEESLHFSDPSEQRVLWLLEAQLERTLVEPLDPDYAKFLMKARKEVNEGH